MEPLVIDWAKEEANMAKIQSYSCLLLIIIFSIQLCHKFPSQVNSTEEVLPNDEF